VTRIALLMLVALAVSSPCFAQRFDECKSYKDAIDELVNAATDDAARTPAQKLVRIESHGRCFAIFVVGDVRLNDLIFQQFVQRFESSRTDKEAGSAHAASGTSIVSQGPAAKVLSAAVEYGAATQSVDGQVITLRANAAGLPSALVRKNVFPYCADPHASEFCVGASALSVLRRVSFSVSFDASRGTQVIGTPQTPAAPTTAQQLTFTAQRNQISAATARVELWNHRDVTSRDFAARWKERVGLAMDRPAAELMSDASSFMTRIVLNDQDAEFGNRYNAWQIRTQALLIRARSDRARVTDVLRTALNEWMVEVRAAQPDIDGLARDALAAYSRFFLAQGSLIDSLSDKNVLALEYTGSRPVGQAGTSNVRLILDLPLTTRTRMVANGAATFYDSVPANVPADVTRYRDAQFGLELDHGLGEQSIIGPAVISVALYYQYQHAPALLKFDPLKPIPGIGFTGLPPNARTVFAEQQSIWLGQAKLSLTPPGSSVKVPLSLTYSNRTELVDKPMWRGQVGLAYDLDSLLGALR